ncbi:hypothetical protein BK816_00055 [Boudabousia tangfeifanii]|uniref:Solute-binding protein family 5 domain-containing protein n=1 Tax=Boudabousia tangfeifanii TaxID=1912795 RepID=A0A1D9MHZ0_9ACTO|nr:ABC transporter family substrate-binding protein [Boudabousia tangfeifanii]AOZ71876.1 hypothetical protein BK816_00055 [Boudabousia tangfeifanii]
MNRAMKTTVSVLAAASLLVTAGCGAEEAKLGKSEKEISSTADYLHVPYEDLKQGGEVTFGVDDIPEQLNAFAGNMTTGTWDIWYWYNPIIALFDDAGEYYPNPDFVTKAEAKDVDGKTVVTYDLNEKAKYNDGTPIDWTVWKATAETGSGKDPDMSLNDSSGYAAIEKVERGSSDFQVVVTYKTQFPWWKKNFSTLMHPKLAAMGAEEFASTYVNNPHPEWGAGPYKVKEVDSKQGIATFVPNENWWGQPAKLDAVHYRYMEGNADMNAFLNGEIDLVGVGNKERLSRLKEGTKIYTGTSRNEAFLTLNSKRPFLGDVKVRTAIFKAIDRDTIMKIRFNGMNYQGVPLGSMLYKPTQPGYNDNLGDLGKFDLEAAKKLLDEAGWKLEDGKEYRTNDKGEELELLLPTFAQDDLSKSINEALLAMFKNAGIKLNLKQSSPADYPKIMQERAFDFMLSGMTADNPFGMGDVCQFYQQGQTLIKAGLGNDEIDKMCQASITASSEEEANKLGNETEAAYFKLAGIMPLLTGPVMVTTKPGLANRGAMGFSRVAPQMLGWAKDGFTPEAK